MKRFFPLLLCFALPLYTGCDEVTKDETANVIIVSRDAVAFAESGGTATVSVACPSDWSGECQENWVGLDKSDGAIVITADANVTGMKRTAVVLLANGADTKEIHVTQAWSTDPVQLYVNSAESVTLDSEGESFVFSVASNQEWTISSDEPWISAEGDCARGIAIVTADANAGDTRTATVTVSASKGDATRAISMDISQISRAENPYYRMLGYFGLYAENWYYRGEPLGYPGTGTHCTIEEDVYGKSFVIRDLFRQGTEIVAGYDRDKGAMTIDLGRACMTMQESATVTYTFFPVGVNFAGQGGFSTSMLTGTLGVGYSDEIDAEGEAILLSGLPDKYPTFGLVVYTGSGYATDGGIYYADGNMYLVKLRQQ
ncbi:MAG: BACON domain-containing protein [Clostridium sp.]|nr:BACON domain-containing protein [Bacteroides sp.]MCM1198563.1 BACON domain-containing protein [Clostridium sp.]